MAGPAHIPLALYLHLPWCVRKCPYCDFNSHRAPDALPEEAYTDALLADLDHDLPLAGGRELVSIFIGGGTPSLFSAKAIARILDGVRARLPLAAGCEITLEANPGTVEQARFTGYREAGVNRLSIGVQSLDDTMLARLGRIHGAAEARAALAGARAAGFSNCNLDLMFALPRQTKAQAADDLAALIALAPAHISYYQLTLEPGTPFHHRPPRLPSGESAGRIHGAAAAALAAAGYGQYEVSAWARPGYACIHNQNYWLFGDYLGIGAGAHAKLTTGDGRILRRAKQPLPNRYRAAAGSEAAVASQRELTPADARFEFLMNALRLNAGFGRDLFEARSGQHWRSLCQDLAGPRARGLLRCEDDHVACTALGACHLDGLLAELLPQAA